MYLTREFTRRFGPGEWYERAASAAQIPNSQVKNFMVACRTGLPEGDRARVVVRGSKAYEGGCLWDRYYAAFLVNHYGLKALEIDFFDLCEKEEKIEYVYNGCTVVLRKFVSLYAGSGEGYNALVDDAYILGEGTQELVPESARWSLKVQDGVGDPYLHVRESRHFSHAGTGNFYSCECSFCSAVGDVSKSYEEFVSVRAFAHALGQPPCQRHIYDKDVRALSTMLAAVHAQPSVILEGGRDNRVALSLVYEGQARPVNSIEITAGWTQDVVFSHKYGFEAVDQRDSYPWLEGKEVAFVGVAPQVLGATKVRAPLSAGFIPSVDVVFAETKEAAMQSAVAPVMYVPFSIVDLRQWMPGWKETGRKVGKYREIEREVTVALEVDDSHPTIRARWKDVVLVRRPFHIYDMNNSQEELSYAGRFPYLYETDGRALRVRGRKKVSLSEVIVDNEDVITYVRYGDAVATVRGYIPGALAYEWRRLHANDLLWADVPENEYKDIQQAKRISLKFPIHSSIVNEVQEAGRRSRANVLRFIFQTRGRAERFFRFIFCGCEAECSCPVRVEGKAEAAGYSFVAENGTKLDKVQSFLVDVAAYFVVNDGVVERRLKAPSVLSIVPVKAQKQKWRKRSKKSPYEKTKKAFERGGGTAQPEDPDYDYDRGEFFASSLQEFRENKEVKA
jgi:hypothetical protein